MGHTPEFVKEKIRETQEAIKDIQEGRRPKTEYATRIVELRYWRTRQIQLGGKH